MMSPVARTLLKIEGTVQGVGFRPFIYRLALRHQLGGMVWNDGKGVYIDAEGKEEEICRFISAVKMELPALASITRMEKKALAPKGYGGFSIAQSQGIPEGKVMVPPDAAICPDCLREIGDPMDRHYRYPFTNCTNCGPRFTIVRELPYDREKTSMDVFPMCPSCSGEYHDPLDRRFHAQPTACPLCGPHMLLVDRNGRQAAGDWLAGCREILFSGGILAVKGLGGFHLACDGTNKSAVSALRQRKNRPHKPFALMCRNLRIISQFCHAGTAEEELLRSPAAPIVLLQKKTGCGLPEVLAPGQGCLGIMLPYTPLHVLLLEQGPPVLVMTSGNYSSLPLCISNEEAMEKLGGIADFFLLHDRRIINPCDDSLAAVIRGKTQVFRRSRGYVPAPIEAPVEKDEITVLGTGGDLKNTFCLLKGAQAFVSQHMGDLTTVEGEENYLYSLKNFQSLIHARPQVVAFDAHPQYRSSQLVGKEDGMVRIAVQHHHAHMASCMADNFLQERVIGAILDGTGYGPDGCSWGFEILTGDYTDFQREVHLAYVPLPGGDQAVRNPWRTAVSYLFTYCGDDAGPLAKRLFPGKEREMEAIKSMLKSGFPVPKAGSCGRFFDAAAALLGICPVSSYEGQAAMELGELAPWPEEENPDQWARSFFPYAYAIEDNVIQPRGTVTALAGDLEKGRPAGEIARRFHDTVIAMVVESVELVSRRTGLRKVVCSGGSWQNRYLLTRAAYFLEKKGFQVFCHQKVPANDGGLSLGQALIGYWRWKRNVSGSTHEDQGNRS